MFATICNIYIDALELGSTRGITNDNVADTLRKLYVATAPPKEVSVEVAVNLVKLVYISVY